MFRFSFSSFWNTGLTAETVETLASFLPDCPNMRMLTLDNNPVKEENWHLFLKDDSPITHLSLRYNRITDLGCIEMGKQLGTPQRSNLKLLSLNLNGNAIADKGMEALAQVNGISLVHCQIVGFFCTFWLWGTLWIVSDWLDSERLFYHVHSMMEW